MLPTCYEFVTPKRSYRDFIEITMCLYTRLNFVTQAIVTVLVSTRRKIFLMYVKPAVSTTGFFVHYNE